MSAQRPGDPYPGRGKATGRTALGQSLWLDYLRRDFLLQGGLRALIERDGVRGVLATPTTFALAIAWTGQYDSLVSEWIRRGVLDSHELYERVAFADVQAAADQLRDVYEGSDRRDGQVSVALSPRHVGHTGHLVAEARHVWRTVERPNLLIEVPSDAAGLAAQRELIAAGISVNAGFVAGLDVHAAAVEAYFAGLEARDGDLAAIAGVATLCVGRVAEQASAAAAVALARLAYRQWKRLHSGRRWTALAARGARPQRLLFLPAAGSRERDTELELARTLVGRDTLCAMPVTMLEALRGESPAPDGLAGDPARAEAVLAQIDAPALAATLLAQAGARYGADYDTLIGALARKRAEVQTGLPPLNPPRG